MYSTKETKATSWYQPTTLPLPLGYSTTGSIDPDNMPDNLRWWLNQYKAEIEAATKTAHRPIRSTATATVLLSSPF